jgi:hypothetical protein
MARLPRDGLVDDHVVLGEDERPTLAIDAEQPSAEPPRAVHHQPASVLAQAAPVTLRCCPPILNAGERATTSR